MIQCAPDDDICYTGQTTDAAYKTTWTKGCGDSSLVMDQCNTVGKFFLKKKFYSILADITICTETCKGDLCNENIAPTMPPTTTLAPDPNGLACYSC